MTVNLLPQPPDTEPPGTCALAVAELHHYWVRGSSSWHLVDADTGECTCEHYIFRCAFRFGDLCKHGQRLLAWLAEQQQCPACHGKGAFVPNGSVSYVNVATGQVDMSPQPCLLCNGTKKR